MRLKKSAALMIAVSLSNLMTVLPTAAAGTILGDADCNGKLTVADAIMINRMIAEEAVDPAAAGLINADTDRNGLVTLDDSVRVLSYLAGSLTQAEFFGTVNEDGYDLTGFAYQWPEVFAKDDSVTITDRSYVSHDISITITDHISDNMAYYVADIYIRDLESFRSAFAKGTYPEPRSAQTDSVRNMAKENNAILAINADYCEIRYTGILYRNGVLYRDVDKDDVVALTYDGVLTTYTNEAFRALSQEQLDQIWQTATFGPALLVDGEPISGYTGAIANANPRSALGYYEPGHYCFVQCDGRQDGYSIGMTMDEFAVLMASLGCTEAYNLDGGTSSEMVFNGERVNQPYNGGRYSSDIFYICEVPETTE